MTLDDKAMQVDRATRQQILTDAAYKCQLNYPNICTISATELADAGTINGTTTIKAACKECRRQRDNRRSQGNRLAAHSIRRQRNA